MSQNNKRQTPKSTSSIDIQVDGALRSILSNNDLECDGDPKERVFRDRELTTDLVYNLVFVIQKLNDELNDQEQRLADLKDMLRYHFDNSPK